MSNSELAGMLRLRSDSGGAIPIARVLIDCQGEVRKLCENIPHRLGQPESSGISLRFPAQIGTDEHDCIFRSAPRL